MILQKNVYKLPTLLVVGSEDNITPLFMQEALKNSVSGECTFYVVDGCAHTFKSKKHLDQMGEVLNQWICSLPD